MIRLASSKLHDCYDWTGLTFTACVYARSRYIILIVFISGEYGGVKMGLYQYIPVYIVIDRPAEARFENEKKKKGCNLKSSFYYRRRSRRRRRRRRFSYR